MRMFALILTVMTTSMLIAQDKVKDQIAESSEKIKELQKERIATLKKVADLQDKLFSNARAEYGEVLNARVQLLKAELEAVEKESDRIDLYKKFAETMKRYEVLAQNKVDSGRGSTAAVLKVKALRLEAEIHLEQAKIREAKEKK